jgi:hypothetical protein
MIDDELLRRVHALPDPALPAALAARTHDVARRAFERANKGGGLAAAATATAVVTAIAIYLTWAIQFLGALAQG